MAEILKTIKDNKIKNIVSITSDVHFTATISYNPVDAVFKEFDPFYEFVIGPIHAGAFGPGELDGTFGPTYEFRKFIFFTVFNIICTPELMYQSMVSLVCNSLCSGHSRVHQSESSTTILVNVWYGGRFVSWCSGYQINERDRCCIVFENTPARSYCCRSMYHQSWRVQRSVQREGSNSTKQWISLQSTMQRQCGSHIDLYSTIHIRRSLH